MLTKLAIFAIGYILGARAGRARYDAIVAEAKDIVKGEEVSAVVGFVRGALPRHPHPLRPPRPRVTRFAAAQPPWQRRRVARRGLPGVSGRRGRRGLRGRRWGW